jgi:hypothetical protein
MKPSKTPKIYPNVCFMKDARNEHWRVEKEINGMDQLVPMPMPISIFYYQYLLYQNIKLKVLKNPHDVR